MDIRAVVVVAAVLAGCSEGSVPKLAELRQGIERSVQAPGMKLYVRQEGRLIEPDPAPHAASVSATVRSFDTRSGVAQVEVAYDRYRMPMLQSWRYDGKAWTDSIDSPIFGRSPGR